jgi:hypothetical protein
LIATKILDNSFTEGDTILVDRVGDRLKFAKDKPEEVKTRQIVKSVDRNESKSV